MRIPQALPWLLSTLMIAALPAAADTTADGEALRTAAQQQDLQTVRKLVEKGVDVDSQSRYGATALFFAAGRGNLDIVKLLLEKGAGVNYTDTFYQATPLRWALFGMEDSEPHRQVVLELLKHKPDDSGFTLAFAVKAEDLDLAKAAIATGKTSAKEIEAARAQAENAGLEDMAALFAEHLPEPEEAETKKVELTAEQRSAYVGNFKNDQLGMKIRVWVEGEELKVQANEQPTLTLDATAENVFETREVQGIELTFSGRGGLMEGFQLAQGGQEFRFNRFSEDKKADETVAETALPPLPEVERGPAANWPSFRGANASGIGDAQGAPTTWNGEKGENVLWKTAIPGIALSSPVVWGDIVFVTTAQSEDADTTFRTGLYGDVDSVDDASIHRWKLYAVRKSDGKILWQKEAAKGTPKVKRHLKSSHANPSPATDGKHVVAHFGSEGLHCFDFDGKLLWKHDTGVLNSGWFYDASYEWGFSASPIIHDGRVIVQTDIQKGSYIAAYDIKTGKELWRTAREEIPTWGTPSVLTGNGEGGAKAEIVTNGTTIRGYDAETGKELWTLTPNSEVTVGTPVVADGLAYVTGGYPPARPIYAVKHGARGDLTLKDDATSSEHIAWSVNPGGTYIPSPIVYRGILYMVHNNGRMAAYDAKTGELYYRKRVGSAASYSASPIAADGRLFITTEEGITHVVRAGKDFEHLGSNELGEVVMSSPAISDGMMLIRGMDHLYALGTPAEEAEPDETTESR